MHTRFRAFWAITTALLLCAEVRAQQAVRWEESGLEAAQRRAAQTRRLVLVHFWSPSCSPCMKMERNVFSQPDVAAAIEANYVPVKVNADQYPHTCRQFGITALPTDLVLTPSGQMVRRFQGAVPAANYMGQLNQVAAEMNLAPPPAIARAATAPPARPDWSAPPSEPPAMDRRLQEPSWGAYRDARPAPELAVQDRPAPGADLPRDFVGQNPAWPARAEDGPAAIAPRDRPPSLADRTSPEVPPGPSPPMRDAAAGPPVGPPPNAVAGNPPLGLEGYCPVELAERRRWVLGTHPWGVIHRGRTYMCAGPEEQKKFLEDPDRYAPVISGDDVVLSLERGQSVPGRREHGVFYRGRVYLFAEEASLQAFRTSPSRYAEVLQTMRTPDASARR